MSLFLKKNTAAFFLLVGLNLLVAFAASFVLPKRFYYDAAIIAYDKGNEIGYFGSYPLTILFYPFHVVCRTFIEIFLKAFCKIRG